MDGQAKDEQPFDEDVGLHIGGNDERRHLHKNEVGNQGGQRFMGAAAFVKQHDAEGGGSAKGNDDGVLQVVHFCSFSAAFSRRMRRSSKA